MKKLSYAIILGKTVAVAATINASVWAAEPDAPPPAVSPQTTQPSPATGETLMADLLPTKGNEAQGRLIFTTAPDGKVSVRLNISQLQPGSVHGLHIHEKGDCSSPDASSAGPHFNPAGEPHGGRTGEERHAGDLGNVEVRDSGFVSDEFEVEGISIGTGSDSIVGRSVVLHEKADDLHSQPAGDSGARIACGVIQPSDTATATSFR